MISFRVIPRPQPQPEQRHPDVVQWTPPLFHARVGRVAIEIRRPRMPRWLRSVLYRLDPAERLRTKRELDRVWDSGVRAAGLRQTTVLGRTVFVQRRDDDQEEPDQ